MDGDAGESSLHCKEGLAHSALHPSSTSCLVPEWNFQESLYHTLVDYERSHDDGSDSQDTMRAVSSEGSSSASRGSQRAPQEAISQQVSQLSGSKDRGSETSPLDYEDIPPLQSPNGSEESPPVQVVAGLVLDEETIQGRVKIEGQNEDKIVQVKSEVQMVKAEVQPMVTYPVQHTVQAKQEGSLGETHANELWGTSADQQAPVPPRLIRAYIKTGTKRKPFQFCVPCYVATSSWVVKAVTLPDGSVKQLGGHTKSRRCPHNPDPEPDAARAYAAAFRRESRGKGLVNAAARAFREVCPELTEQEIEEHLQE